MGHFEEIWGYAKTELKQKKSNLVLTLKILKNMNDSQNIHQQLM